MRNACILAGMICAFAVGYSQAEAACTAPACTKIIDNGPDAGKKILVVLGDGYAAADQTKWQQDVDNMIRNGVFTKDLYKEDQNAFNVYRIDLVSNESGVGQRVYDDHGTWDYAPDDTIVSTTYKDTALKYLFSGSWAHCWMEGTADTGARITAALNAYVPNWNYWVVILNEDRYGGCGGGGTQVVTRGDDWSVVAHEYGHGIGGLSDEYTTSQPYTGSAINGVNCSTVLDRTNVYWNRFIDPATPLPTTFTASMDSNRSVGMFQGCGTKSSGIYRPVDNCRMNGNSPPYCPVCWTRMKGLLYSNAGHDFDNAVVGDFSGDGKSDVLIANDNDYSLYKSLGTTLDDNLWIANNVVPSAGGGTWQPAPNDQLAVGDFDGDGKDDVYVFNGNNWSMPYLAMLRSDGTGLGSVARYDSTIPGVWTMKPNDKLIVGDWDGDGKKDLAIFNGTDWSTPYLLVMRSTGTSLAYIARYDGTIPGWSMAAKDQFFPGDFDGDGKADLYVYNGENWSVRYLAMLRSSGTGLASVKRFDNALPGWSMGAADQFFVGDFDGDGKKDLYVFNGANWSYAYLLMVRSTGGDLAYVARYDSSSGTATTPGWSLGKNDRFFISDADRNGRADLFVFNPALDWSTEYLGTLLSTGTGLSGSWTSDWVGNWNLGNVDKLLPAHYNVAAGNGEIVIRNTQWIGLLRRTSSGFVADRVYNKWIYNPKYDSRPWSDTLP